MTYKELRLAVVMNGGVSLAVWIGGVAHELLSFVSNSDRYQSLVDVARVRPVIDVISGTSAGGINGAVLADSLMNGRDDLESVRSMWITEADFSDLLRPPTVNDPASLLRDRQDMNAMIRRAFGVSEVVAPPQELTLIMTGSLIHGRTSRYPDAFSSDVVDTDHGILFKFDQDDWSESTDGRPVADRLAKAAQVSSAFPGAFEPVWLNQSELERTVRPHYVPPNVKGAWAFDGGVILNKPIRPALDAVFARKTAGDVRRVLLYVVPDPGSSDRRAAGHDATFADVEEEDLPRFAQTTWAALATLPRNQSVGAEIDEIRQHNSDARTFRDFRTRLAASAGSQLVFLARVFEDAYREIASATSAERSAQRMIEYLSDSGKLGQLPVGYGSGLIQRELHRARLAHIPRPFLPDKPVSTYGESEPGENQGSSFWGYGIQHAQSIAFTVIDYAQQVIALLPPLPQHENARNTAIAVKAACEQALEAMTKAALPNIKGWWQPFVERLLDQDTNLAQWADEFYKGWNVGNKREPFQAVGDEALSCARELATLQESLSGQIDLSPTDPERFERIQAALHALTVVPQTPYADLVQPFRDLFELLTGTAPGEDGRLGTSSPVWPYGQDEWALRQLLALELIHTATGAPRVRPQEVEVMQVSGFTHGAVNPGGRSSPADKLTGVRLGHFGAFYKRAWRANDWMWGRLDSAARIVDLTLVRTELRQASLSDPGDLVLRIKDAITQSPVDHIGRYMLQQYVKYQDAVEAECAALMAEPTPDSSIGLKTIRRLVTLRLQLEVLDAELPRLEAALDADIARGHSRTSTEASFKSLMADLRTSTSSTPVERIHKLRRAFEASRLAEDKVADVVASDRFSATASQAGLVASTALRASLGENKLVKTLLSPVRGAMWMIYLLLHSLSHDSTSTLARFSYILLFAVAGGVIAATFVSTDPGALLSGVAAVLVLAILLLAARPGQPWRKHLGVSALGAISILFIWNASTPADRFESVGIDPLANVLDWIAGQRVALSILLAVATLTWIGALSSSQPQADGAMSDN